MADNKNAPADQKYNDDGTENPDYVEPKKDGEGDAPDSKKDGANADKDGEADKKGDEPDFDDDATPEIPVRNSVAQHIIARKNEKIKKLESKLDDKEDDIIDDDDSDLTPEASGAIAKEVEKRIAPIVETLVSKADEEELKNLFATEPEAKKYEKHIKAYMAHESYKGVSPAVIYHHLAFNNAQAVGARKKQVADLEANKNRSGGRGLPPKNTVGDLPSPEDIADMSEAEFEAMETDARQGKYIKK